MKIDETALRTERFDLTKVLPGPQHCSACAERVCAGVQEVAGVMDARCDSVAGVVDITYDPAVIPLEQLQDAVDRYALEESVAVGHAVYRLEGLD